MYVIWIRGFAGKAHFPIESRIGETVRAGENCSRLTVGCKDFYCEGCINCDFGIAVNN